MDKLLEESFISKDDGDNDFTKKRKNHECDLDAVREEGVGRMEAFETKTGNMTVDRIYFKKSILSSEPGTNSINPSTIQYKGEFLTWSTFVERFEEAQTANHQLNARIKDLENLNIAKEGKLETAKQELLEMTKKKEVEEAKVSQLNEIIKDLIVRLQLQSMKINQKKERVSEVKDTVIETEVHIANEDLSKTTKITNNVAIPHPVKEFESNTAKTTLWIELDDIENKQCGCILSDDCMDKLRDTSERGFRLLTHMVLNYYGADIQMETVQLSTVLVGPSSKEILHCSLFMTSCMMPYSREKVKFFSPCVQMGRQRT